MTSNSEEQAAPPLLISQEEAARVLSVERTTIWRMWKRGDIQTAKIGSRRLVTYASLIAYVNSETEDC